MSKILKENHEKLNQIKRKIEALKLDNKRFKDENGILKSKLDQLQSEILFQKSVQNPEKIVKIAELFQGAEKKDLVKQLSNMIKNIDQCISILEMQTVETINK